MIDLHVHLLPGVDDGPKDEFEAIALARALAEAGVSRAVVTPHIDDWTVEKVPDRHAVKQRTETLQALLDTASVPLQIQPGGECYFSLELAGRLEAGELPTWGKSPCLLVELAQDQHVHHLGLLLSQIRRAGARVLLAHPERYKFVHTQPDALDDLVESGLMLQITAAAFRAGARPNIAETLLRRGLVHIVASDAHNARSVQGLIEGLERLRAIAGDAITRQLCEENPYSLLEGTEPLQAARVGEQPRRRWFRFGSGNQ